MDRSLLRKISTAVLTIVTLLAVLAGSFIAALVRWAFSVWHNLKIDEILYHLTAPLEGTGDGLIRKFVIFCIVPAVLICILSAIVLRKYRDHKNYLLLSSGLLVFFAALGALSFGYASHRLELGSYIANHVRDNSFIEDNYADPKSVSVTFPGRGKNLVYIYLESMEMTYADPAHGGAFERNVIPELTELALENECFSGDPGVLNGGYVMPGTTFTMGGMFAQTSGLPLKVEVGNNFFLDNGTGVEGIFNDMGSQSSFFPGVMTLGDILEKEGYEQVLLIGSEASFGGRDLYFKEHGNYSIEDLNYAREAGWLPYSYEANRWGYEDEKLFEFARKRLTELSKEDAPFNLTLLTVDTHFEDGYPCRLCRNDFDDQYSNVFACSSRQVTEFVKWIAEQDFYEDTVIILAGDHLTMDGDYCENVDKTYHRRVYTDIINAAPSGKEKNGREYTTMDLFPTTLAAMGAKIEGDRLGLGANLYSGEETLIEQYGEEGLSDQISKRSSFMESLADIDLYNDKMVQKVMPAAMLRAESYNGETSSLDLVVWKIKNLSEDVEAISASWYENDAPGKKRTVRFKKRGEGDDLEYFAGIDLSGLDIENTTVDIDLTVSSGFSYRLMSLSPDPSIYEFHAYMKWLKEKLASGDYEVLISVQKEAAECLDEQSEKELHELGLKTDISGEFENSYLAVIGSNGVVHEEADEGVLEYHHTLEDGHKAVVISEGANCGSLSSVIIDGKQYSPDDRGLNFVLYHHGEHEVKDAVCFDTHYNYRVSGRDL